MLKKLVNLKLNKIIKVKTNRVCDGLDPFYSKNNLNRLYKAIDDMNNKRNISEHELIDID